MIQKTNIPKQIPNSISDNGFRMVPIKIFNQINNTLIYRKNDLNIEQKIAEDNNHDDIIKYKYYEEYFSIIQEDIYDLFNQKLFWNLNMNSRVCDHKYKNGTKKGLICGRRIDIKVDQNCKEENGKWRCGKHVSMKVYKPMVKNIDLNDLCINKTGYKDKYNCKMKKKYGCYCIHHYMENNSFNNTDIKLAKIYYNEIKLLNNIEVENTNNSLIKSYKYNCNINNSINIIDKYENNGYKYPKLICYNNNKNKSLNNIVEKLLINNKEELKVKPFKEKSLENKKNNNINKINTGLIDLNINIDNFKYKEILNISPKCNSKDCTNINDISIIKYLYCKKHATIVNNNSNRKKYQFNNWNYIIAKHKNESS